MQDADGTKPDVPAALAAMESKIKELQQTTNASNVTIDDLSAQLLRSKLRSKASIKQIKPRSKGAIKQIKKAAQVTTDELHKTKEELTSFKDHSSILTKALGNLLKDKVVNLAAGVVDCIIHKHTKGRNQQGGSKWAMLSQHPGMQKAFRRFFADIGQSSMTMADLKVAGGANRKSRNKIAHPGWEAIRREVASGDLDLVLKATKPSSLKCELLLLNHLGAVKKHLIRT
jgi:seryl-tRNA synthetase